MKFFRWKKSNGSLIELISIFLVFERKCMFTIFFIPAIERRKKKKEYTHTDTNTNTFILFWTSSVVNFAYRWIHWQYISVEAHKYSHLMLLWSVSTVAVEATAVKTTTTTTITKYTVFGRYWRGRHTVVGELFATTYTQLNFINFPTSTSMHLSD